MTRPERRKEEKKEAEEAQERLKRVHFLRVPLDLDDTHILTTTNNRRSVMVCMQIHGICRSRPIPYARVLCARTSNIGNHLLLG